MASETVVTPPTPGAGRILDCAWPGKDTNPWSGISLNIETRIGSYTGGRTLTHGVQTAGGAIAWAVYQGVDCLKLTAPAAAGSGDFYTSPDVLRCHVRTTKGHPLPGSCTDFAVYRTYINAAFPTIPAADNDMGLELLPQSSGGTPYLINGGGSDGIAITRGADGHMYLMARAGGVLKKYAIDTAAGFDPTLFHAYELRLTSATKVAEASLKCLVDGVLVQTLNWGAGTVLPVSNNANPGFLPGIFSMEGNAGVFYLEQWRVIYGPTEQATL